MVVTSRAMLNRLAAITPQPAIEIVHDPSLPQSIALVATAENPAIQSVRRQ